MGRWSRFCAASARKALQRREWDRWWDRDGAVGSSNAADDGIMLVTCTVLVRPGGVRVRTLNFWIFQPIMGQTEAAEDFRGAWESEEGEKVATIEGGGTAFERWNNGIDMVLAHVSLQC